MNIRLNDLPVLMQQYSMQNPIGQVDRFFEEDIQ